MVKCRAKIVVVPGWTKTKEKIWPLVQGLKEKGHQVRLLLVPGLTGRELNRVWTLDDYRRWLARELAGEQQVILVGHSNGGRIILKYLSERQDEEVLKAVLIDVAGIVDRKWYKVWKRWWGKMMAKLGGGLKSNLWLRKVFYKILRERDYYEANEMMRETMANLLREDLRERLGGVKTEILLLWGQKDKLTPLYLGREMATLLPQARLKIIKGARHSPQATHTEEVVAEIERFLDGEI